MHPLIEIGDESSLHLLGGDDLVVMDVLEVVDSVVQLHLWILKEVLQALGPFGQQSEHC